MQDFGIVLAAIRPLDFDDRFDTVLTGSRSTLDLVYAWSIWSILDNQCGIGSHFIDVGSRDTRVGTTVLVLEIGDLQCVLVKWILDEST